MDTYGYELLRNRLNPAFGYPCIRNPVYPSILVNYPKKMKMKKALLYLSLPLVFGALPAAGQYQLPENNIWALEHKAGIDFTSGNPVAIETSILSSGAAASVCDGDGE